MKGIRLDNIGFENSTAKQQRRQLAAGFVVVME
jgi:hypothetical protein